MNLNWLPTLEYSLTHPHPKGHIFLLSTFGLFIIMLPILVIVNLATLGFDLVPTLQPRFQPNDILLEGWWGTRRLPPALRPRPAPCQPKELGRGDIFRLSGSLFDYTVMSTWNTSEGTRASGIQEQKRAEYRGQSFANCYVNSARYDYNLVEQTNTVAVGVLCPGSPDYPIEISMQTTITYALEASKDFIGQYYGPGLDLLNLTNADPSDYRKVVLAALEVLSTDASTIMRRQHISSQPLSMRVVFTIGPDSPELLPRVSTLTYANGTQPSVFPEEALIYVDTIYNLVVITADAVNLDLGSHEYPNIFRSATRLSALLPNLPPPGVSRENWAQPGQAFYYGNITSPYQTWAEALLNGQPVKLDGVTGLPNESVMATTYLCPSYRIKPTRALLASVFVGASTMTMTLWGAWMVFTTFLARQIMEPKVICHCMDCELRREKEKEGAREREANPGLAPSGIVARLMERMGFPRPTKPTLDPGDLERAGFDRLEEDESPQPRGLAHLFKLRYAAYHRSPTTGER
ncbi:unnamed protein product [Rhizoctonia solani]|uniref:Transmembrane protein n=1 Tax=Rhizoctonia solani TaxID=456999 RepID=A0A8H3DP13_9AGAM|nr:unnamed protein product [Rhizoctonia solani]